MTKCNDMQYTQEMSRKTNEDLLCRLMDTQSTIQGLLDSKDSQNEAMIELQTELEESAIDNTILNYAKLATAKAESNAEEFKVQYTMQMAASHAQLQKIEELTEEKEMWKARAQVLTEQAQRQPIVAPMPGTTRSTLQAATQTYQESVAPSMPLIPVRGVRPAPSPERHEDLIAQEEILATVMADHAVLRQALATANQDRLIDIEAQRLLQIQHDRCYDQYIRRYSMLHLFGATPHPFTPLAHIDTFQQEAALNIRGNQPQDPGAQQQPAGVADPMDTSTVKDESPNRSW